MDKSVNTTTEQFQSNITLGLLAAYKAAFIKVQNLFTIQNNRRSVMTTLRFDPNQLKLVLTSSQPNGKTNPDKSKNQVDLRYYLIDGTTGQSISAELAADSINLLTSQELTRFLGQDVVEKGYVEAQPRASAGGSDDKLWIIAAVLGPLVALFVIFWVIFWIYYKCINTQKRRMMSKSNVQIIRTDSPDSVIKK